VEYLARIKKNPVIPEKLRMGLVGERVRCPNTLNGLGGGNFKPGAGGWHTLWSRPEGIGGLCGGCERSSLRFERGNYRRRKKKKKDCGMRGFPTGSGGEVDGTKVCKKTVEWVLGLGFC